MSHKSVNDFNSVSIAFKAIYIPKRLFELPTIILIVRRAAFNITLNYTFMIHSNLFAPLIKSSPSYLHNILTGGNISTVQPAMSLNLQLGKSTGKVSCYMYLVKYAMSILCRYVP